METRFYTINEVAAMFGVTRTAVYDWMNAGKLAFVVIGSRRRFTQAALDAFVLSGTQPEATAGDEEVDAVNEKKEAPELAAA